MTTETARRLVPHFESSAQAAASTMTFAPLSAGNVVPVDDPAEALPLGGVRMVRATLAGDTGLDIVVAFSDAVAEAAFAEAGTDDLVTVLQPAVHALTAGLAALVGTPLDLEGLYEMGVGDPLGIPGTEAFTAGFFAGDEQVGNAMFFVAPGALEGSAPAPAAASFNDADAHAPVGAEVPAANSLSLLRGVEMRVTAELGRTHLPVSHVLDLGPGSVVELDRNAGTPVDVLVNGTIIARGEVVVLDEEYGVRITEIVGMENS